MPTTLTPRSRPVKQMPILHLVSIVLLLLGAACSGAAGPASPPVVSSPASAAAPASLTAPMPVPAPPGPPAHWVRTNVRTNVFRPQYDPSARADDTTALNGDRVPFAVYLNSIHNRIHPIFAGEYLASLDSLAKSHPLNQPLSTHLDIVLNKDTGRIVRMGVTKSSGAPAFDIVALSAVHRAQPFGQAPDIIASPDGNVYVHGEFHRDPFDACSTRNAWPFILKSAP